MENTVPRPVHPVVTFIVRVTHTDAGEVRAVIERASTGDKQPVDGCEAVGPVIAAMLAAEKEQKS